MLYKMINTAQLTELFGTPATLFVTGVLFIETMLLLSALFAGHIYKKQSPKTLTIIRGPPGSGKKYLVSQMEQDNNEVFAICDKNQYFVHDGEYNFKGSELSKAEQSSRLKLLNSISKGIRNIYVINYFNELWMYQEYLQIAKMHNYKTQILEIPCIDREHLSYFNKRSVYKTPYSKSKSCYTNWESDSRSIYCEPYIQNFPGDCLPNVISVNLDKQLDDYKTGLYETTTEDSMTESTSVIKYKRFIDFIPQSFYNKIFRRESNNETGLKKAGKYDLREHAPARL